MGCVWSESFQPMSLKTHLNIYKFGRRKKRASSVFTHLKRWKIDGKKQRNNLNCCIHPKREIHSKHDKKNERPKIKTWALKTSFLISFGSISRSPFLSFWIWFFFPTTTLNLSSYYYYYYYLDYYCYFLLMLLSSRIKFIPVSIYLFERVCECVFFVDAAPCFIFIFVLLYSISCVSLYFSLALC